MLSISQRVDLREMFAELTDWEHGGDPDATADHWAALEFTAREAQEWLELARCFDADAANDLRALGITPEQASMRTSRGHRDIEDTIGYKVSNGDRHDIEAAAIINETA